MDSLSPIGQNQPSSMAKRAKMMYQFTDASAASGDSVTLSSDVLRLRGVEGIRYEKVMEVRGQLARGEYMTPEKLDVALDRMLDKLFREPL